MISFNLPDVINLQWTALGILGLILWLKIKHQRLIGWFVFGSSFIISCYFLGIVPPDLLLVVGFTVFVADEAGFRFLIFLIMACFLLLIAALLPEWFLVFMVLMTFLVMINETWKYLKFNSLHKSLYSSLLLVLLGVCLIIGLDEWIFGLLFTAFIVLQINSFPFFAKPASDVDEQWFTLVETTKENERQRIYRNIHDEVGADLLQLIYLLDGHLAQKQAKSVMQKVRQSVAETAKHEINFDDLFTDICQEAKLRLSLADIEFTSHLTGADKYNLEMEIPAGLTRIMRELISNIIKHANATKVSLLGVWGNDKKILRVRDDGTGMSSQNSLGKGLKSIRQRAAKINADVNWLELSAGGTEVELIFKNYDQ